MRLSNEPSEMDVVAVAPKAISGRIGLGLKISRQGYVKSTFSLFSMYLGGSGYKTGVVVFTIVKPFMAGPHRGGGTLPQERGWVIDHLYSAPSVIVDHIQEFTRDQIAYNR